MALPAPEGSLALITGPMFSGKSSELLARLRRACLAGWPAVLLRHRADDRYGGRLTHDGGAPPPGVPEQRLGALAEAQLPPGCRLVAVDEGQFFADLAPCCAAWAAAGLQVVVAALAGAHDRSPFAPVAELLPHCDELALRRAVCGACRAREAPFTRRRDEGGDAPGVLRVGGAELYQAVCRACWSKLKPAAAAYLPPDMAASSYAAAAAAASPPPYRTLETSSLGGEPDGDRGGRGDRGERRDRRDHRERRDDRRGDRRGDRRRDGRGETAADEQRRAVMRTVSRGYQQGKELLLGLPELGRELSQLHDRIGLAADESAKRDLRHDMLRLLNQRVSALNIADAAMGRLIRGLFANFCPQGRDRDRPRCTPDDCRAFDDALRAPWISIYGGTDALIALFPRLGRLVHRNDSGKYVLAEEQMAASAVAAGRNDMQHFMRLLSTIHDAVLRTSAADISNAANGAANSSVAGSSAASSGSGGGSAASATGAASVTNSGSAASSTGAAPTNAGAGDASPQDIPWHQITDD